MKLIRYRNTERRVVIGIWHWLVMHQRYLSNSRKFLIVILCYITFTSATPLVLTPRARPPIGDRLARASDQWTPAERGTSSACGQSVIHEDSRGSVVHTALCMAT